MSDASGTSAWSYDSMGRAVTLQRTIAGFTRTASYQYNHDGSIALDTIFSTKQLKYTYSGAARPLSVTDPSSSPAFNFVTGAKYFPPGALASATFANSTTFAGITETDTYNSRLQPIKRSASSPSATIFSLNYDFHLSAGDNGSVYQIVNNRDSNRTQNFTYDALNRLSSAYTTSNLWGTNFVVDAWGNLTNMNPMAGKVDSPNLQAAPASTSNQLTGFGYDAAGNLTSNGSATYNYDAEGQQDNGQCNLHLRRRWQPGKENGWQHRHYLLARAGWGNRQ
jgi:hypothetical protein